MIYKRRDYGKKVNLTEFNIKVYDKTLEQRLHYNINTENFVTRFEIGFYKKRSVKYISTLADLIDISNLKKLLEKLLNAIMTIEYFPSIEYLKTLPPKEREIIYALYNSKYWEVEGELNFEATKKKRGKFLTYCRLVSPTNFIRNALNTKFEEIMI